MRRARTRCAPSCAPSAWRPHSHAERTRRHRPRRGPGLAPRPGPAELHRQPAGSEVGGRYHVYPHLGGVRVPGDRCRLLHEESSRVRDWGDSMRTDLICEAIDMAARRYPYTTGETILLPRAGAASTPPSSSATTWRATALALRWAGPGCAGRKSAGATLKEREGLSDGPPPQEARPSGILPPGSSWNTIRNDSTPPWGTGRPTRSRRSTEQ